MLTDPSDHSLAGSTQLEVPESIEGQAFHPHLWAFRCRYMLFWGNLGGLAINPFGYENVTYCNRNSPCHGIGFGVVPH